MSRRALYRSGSLQVGLSTLENEKKKAHISVMTKAVAVQNKLVRLSNGKTVELRGYGSLKAYDLKLIPGLDLTKPIYEQVIRETPPKAAAIKS